MTTFALNRHSCRYNPLFFLHLSSITAFVEGKNRFDTALGIISKNANIHPGRSGVRVITDFENELAAR